MNNENMVYAVFEHETPDELQLFTTSHALAGEYKAKHHQVFGAEPSVVATILHQSLDLHHEMSDKTWLTLADGLKTLHENRLKHSVDQPEAQETEGPFFNVTPLDLPHDIAETRLQKLKIFMSTVNLPAERELIECLMAYKYSRPVNEDLFTEESRKTPSRQEQIESSERGRETEATLYRDYENVKRQNQHTAKMNETPKREDLIEEAQLLQERLELELLIEAQDEHFELIDEDYEDLDSAPGL